jgi:hypothetical protein
VPGDRVDDDCAWQEFHFTPPCVVEPVDPAAMVSEKYDHVKIWLEMVMLQMH